MRTLLSISVVYCFAVASGQLTVKPQNVVGKVGSSVSLACATDSGVVLKWDEYITNPAEAQTIVSGSNFIIPGTTKYGLLTTPAGNYQLTVNSLTLQNAGRYSCKYSTNSNIAASTEVIIFESDPICKNNVTNNEAVEGDYIKYSCEVTYKGKWAPVMEWKYNDAVVQATDESTGNTVKYTFVTELTHAHNGQNFTCRTYFDQPKPENVQVKHADNKPITDNVHTDFTSQLTVYYGPRSLMVTPIKESYYPGDEVKVTADSNPSLTTYTWVNTATNQTLGTGHTIVIPADMLGSQLLTITVCSSIPIPPENTICKNNQLNITVIPKPTTTTTTTTTPATTTTTKTPVPPFGGSTTTTIKPSDKPDKNGPGHSTDENGKQTLTTGAIVGISLGAVAFIIILICCCVYFIRIRKRKSADESHPMHMDSTHRKQQVPVDQVRSPDILNPTYGRQNEFTPSLNDSVPPPTRTPEDITYADLAMMHDNQADLAIDDVPRSRKPLQVFEPGSGVEYASIQPNHRTH